MLHRAGRQLTPGEVSERLGGGLAYSTVVTILSRLHAKGVLVRHRRQRAYAYAPVTDPSGLAAHQMRQVLDSGADRAAVLQYFVSGLRERDEHLLRKLLSDPSAGPRYTAGGT